MTEPLKPKLVAETDATGRVTQVSLSLPDWRAARLEGAEDALQGILATSEFHGAPAGDIAEWLQRNWHG